MLTGAQRAAYDRDGFIVVPDVFSAEDIAELRRVTDEFVSASATATANDAIYDLEDTHSPDDPRVRGLKAPHAIHPVYMRASRHPKIVELLTDLWGSLRFDTGKLNMKSVGDGTPIEWQQDWAFYPHTNEDLAAVGIMIDDVDLKDGPMMVVPGSHKGPIYDHHGPDGRFRGAMDPENCSIDLSSAAPCLGQAGSITIHHVRAVHSSAPNVSGRSCRFLLFQYRAADAWPLLGLTEGIEKFNEQLIVGEPSLAPRLVPLPVRMPLPPAEYQGSIYENQRETMMLIRWVGRIWETAKVMGLILWPIRFILLVLLGMIVVLCLTQAKDALFGSVIEWTHPWLTLVAVSIWALLTWYWSRVLLDLPQKSGTDYLYTDPEFRNQLYQKFRLYIPRILGVVVFFIVGVFIRLSAIGSEIDGWWWLAVYAVCGIIFYALTAFRRLVINEIDEPSAPESALKRSVAVVQRSVPAMLRPKQSTANEPATKGRDARRMEAVKRAHPIEPLRKVDVLIAPEAGLKATAVFAIGWLVLLFIMASSAIWRWPEAWREPGTIVIAGVLAMASIILVWFWRGEFHKKRIWAFCLSTLAGAAFFICSIARPARFGILFGPAVVLMLSAAMWVAASSVFLAFPGHRLRLPVTTFLIGSMLLFGAIPKWFVQSWGDHDNHAVRVASGGIDVDGRMTLLGSFDRWYQQAPCRLDENSCKKKPMVIVVLEGGASRSAYWSAMILGALQDALPEFHKRIFAISSVSGGSLGAAVYQRLVAAGLNGTAPTCGQFQGYAVCAQRVLQYDFLGASFFSMFTSDLLQRLAPGALLPDRAEALERAWERAWSAELKSGDFDQPLKIRLVSSGNEKWLPVLLLNGSSVKTGRRIVTSDVALDVNCHSSDASAELSTLPSAVDFFCLTRSPVRLSTAVHNSARFPYISPAGTIWATDGKGEPWKADRIVDGGYFEALGATTVSDLLIKLRKEDKLEKVEPIVLVIENDPTQHSAACSTFEADDVECRARDLATKVGEEAGTMSFRVRNSDDAVAPVIGLAASRTGRGTYAGRALEAELAVIGMQDRLVRFNLS